MHDSSNGSGSVNCGITNNGDLVSRQHVPRVGRVQRASSRSGGGLCNGSSWSVRRVPHSQFSNTLDLFGGNDDSGSAMAAAHQQAKG